jgi:hypothetical protein
VPNSVANQCHRAWKTTYLWPPEPPPEDQSLLELLERELGAHPVPATDWYHGRATTKLS